MPRPRTEVADFKPFTFRLPPAMLAELKARSLESGVPMNVLVVRYMQKGMAALRPHRKRDLAAVE
jgi:hypothetical protein